MDRSSQREPKLILLEGGAMLACSVQKKIISVENLSAEEFENRPMKIVAARFCNQRNIGATIAPVSCVVEACLDLELLNAVRIGNRNSATASSTALYVAYANSVQLEVIVIGTCSVNVNPIIVACDLGQRGPTKPKLSCVVHSG